MGRSPRPRGARAGRRQACFGVGLELLLDDVRGAPVAAVRLELPRDVYARGLVGTRLLLASTVAAGLFFGLVVMLLLEFAVLRRVGRLTRDVRRVAAGADHSLRVGVDGADELGQLASDVNGMLASLERLTGMLDQARAMLREAFGRYVSATR